MTTLSTALSRLEAFRQSWNTGDQICEDCGLTADDLDVVIEAARKAEGLVAVEDPGKAR